MPSESIALDPSGQCRGYESESWNGIRVPILDAMTKITIERSEAGEVTTMRARWKEDRAAGATGETFARWRKRIKSEVIGELREILNGDPRKWPDPRKRDLGKPERRKRVRPV
jgi:hypothetical protein